MSLPRRPSPAPIAFDLPEVAALMSSMTVLGPTATQSAASAMRKLAAALATPSTRTPGATGELDVAYPSLPMPGADPFASGVVEPVSKGGGFAEPAFRASFCDSSALAKRAG